MRIALVAVLTLLALYLADGIMLGLEREPYGVVQLHRYYAMPLKGGRTEFGDAGIERETCVHALFPHWDFPPCWFAGLKKEKLATQ